MDDDNKVSEGLTAGAMALVEAALNAQQEERNPCLSVGHWLVALLERHGPMAEALLPGLKAGELLRQLRGGNTAGRFGNGLAREVVVENALARARARGKERASEQDVAAAVLAAAGLSGAEPAESTPATESEDRAAAETGYVPRCRMATPTLDKFGRDVTREAQAKKLSRLVGREEELQLVVETLCRRTKRNPALVGPAGSGKTAIVEGLAQLVVEGRVPEALRGVRVIALAPSSLVAGAGVVGELEKRMKAVLEEAAHDGIILFIDEMHSMVGAGGREGSGDVASLLKPALARGDIACIAATTDDEFRRLIEPDAALARRFQPIRVQEMTAEQTRVVLRTLRNELRELRGVDVDDGILDWLVEFASQFLRNRFFPDKAVDLLEQCVAYAVTRGAKAVGQADAEAVAQRMIGMPLSLDVRLAALKSALTGRGLMKPADVGVLVNRLEVTLRGLDVHASRPNAVVLLADEAAQESGSLAAVIAEALYGAAERVVTIDFGRFTEQHDLSMLIGTGPGYVGFDIPLPLHTVAQMPWCVLCCENVDLCHPAVREVLTQALRDGFITDARSRRIFLSDAVVLLTARLPVEQRRAGPLGFGTEGQETRPADGRRRQAEAALGPELASRLDLVCTERPGTTDVRAWVRRLLDDVAGRFRSRGLELDWDESVVEWLLKEQTARAGAQELDRLVDDCLLPGLVGLLPDAGGEDVKKVRVKCRNNAIQVDRYQNEEV